MTIIYIYIYIYINKLRHNKQFSMHLFYLGLREYQKVGVRNNRSEQCLSLLNVIFIIYINSRIINEVSSDIISLNPCVFVKIWTLSNKCNLSNEEAFGSLKQPKKPLCSYQSVLETIILKAGTMVRMLGETKKRDTLSSCWWMKCKLYAIP